MGALSTIQRAAASAAFKAAYGADFETSFATGLVRCETEDWAPDAGNEVTDFVAVVVGTVLLAKSAEGGDRDFGPLLRRTFLVLAKRDGYKEGDQAPAAPSKAASNLLIVLGAIIILAEVAFFAYVIYRATMLVTNTIAQYSAAKELMRAHRDAMQVVEDHARKEEQAGHPLPYDKGELAVLATLQSAQDGALQTNTGAIGASEGSGVAEVGGGVVLGLVAAAALAIYLLSPKRK